MGIAVGAAIIVGDAISGRRFYWAVIAAFITFMGANTAGEQMRKSVFRVAGTVVGVIVGSVLAHRLAETSVGAGVAILTVLLVLPLHVGRVSRVAARQQLEALAELADRCLDRLPGPGGGARSD